MRRVYCAAVPTSWVGGALAGLSRTRRHEPDSFTTDDTDIADKQSAWIVN